MLPSEQPDRINIAFDDHRLVANAGLLLPATLAHHLGLGEPVDQHVDLGRCAGSGEWGRQDTDVDSVGVGRWRLHRRRRRAARWQDRTGAGLGSQGAIHLGDPSCAASGGVTCGNWIG